MALKVGVLVGTVDTGVAKATAWLRFFVEETNLMFGIVETVEPLAFAALTPDDFNLALFCPAAKSA